MFNVDKFDRYCGGHPNEDTIYRGNSQGLPGQLRNYQQEKIELMDDYGPDYRVSHADAEEFHVFQYTQKDQIEEPKTWHRVFI